MAGVILLVGMYASTMVFALSNSPRAVEWLKASIYCTIIVPILLYAYLFVYRMVHKPSLPDVPANATSPAPISAKEKVKVDTVIFDIGKVLVEWDWRPLLHEMGYDAHMTEVIEQAIFQSPDWGESDRGVRTEEEILASYIQNAPDYEQDIRKVFASIGKTIHTYPYTHNWIDKLHQMGCRVYYLSNYSEPLYQQSKEELSFMSKMDGGYMSYQLKCLKPDFEIYQKLLDHYSLIPEKCVFIDDRPENIASAKAMGMKAIQFIDYQKTVKELSGLLS